ncbi:MAG: hypothetical protein JWN56_303 [Sphingobacteriales bacterium]|nr:hypothetical protein [Sphingobacteriales bacterium]
MHLSFQPFSYPENTFNINSKKVAPYKFFWGMWIAALVLIVFVYSLTIAVAPYLHADEFMTLDLGRIVLNPETTWSIAWITSKNHPVFFIFYLGPVLQELSYTTFGQYGPRISAILGALVASTVLVRWLLLKGTHRNAAFILGLVFLLDPIFVQAYTMARVDGWTMAFCLLSCCLICRSVVFSSNYKLLKSHLFFAGVFAAIGLFIWPSAIFLFPLIIFELYSLFVKLKTAGVTIKQRFLLVILMGVGGVLASVIILIPLIPQLIQKIHYLIDGVTVNTQSGAAKGSVISNLFSSGIKLLSVLKFTPVVFFLAAIAFILRKQTGLILACLTASFIMMFTLVYIHRVQYLLPYFIVAIASVYSLNQISSKKIELNRFKKLIGLTLLLFWSVFFSIGIRSYFAAFQHQNRDRDLVYHAANALLGKGNHAVFAPFEFYYPGRKLGWKLYGPYIPYDEVFTSTMFANILSNVDYVIIKNDIQIPSQFINQMNNEGLYERDSYQVYAVKDDQFNGKTTFTSSIRNLYSIFRQPYGPYKLFIRQGIHNRHLSNK